MKTIKLLAGVVGAILLAGCATTFKPWLLSDVNEGMSKAQVVQILGEPDSVEMKDGQEILRYSYQEDRSPNADTGFQSDPTIEKRVKEFEQSLNEFSYVVILADDKVLTYKELEN